MYVFQWLFQKIMATTQTTIQQENLQLVGGFIPFEKHESLIKKGIFPK